MKPTDPRIPAGYNWLVQQVGHQSDDCLLWPFSCCTPGYGMFMFKKKRRLAHRFMCEQKHGTAPSENHHAAHACGNRRCVNPNHLTWKTQSDNQFDRRVHNTNNKTRTKLTPLQAGQIRQLKGRETAIETAARYGITESNVRQIQNGDTWKVVGRKHRQSLTHEQVRTIRRLRESPTQIAQTLGLTLQSIYRVLDGTHFKGVV